MRDSLVRLVSTEDLDPSPDIDESQGDYPSPSILVNGVDVMGDPGYRVASCRLDVPTRAAILKTLRRP
jgi:hypothetical protein